MISQGKLFPFEELKEQKKELYSEEKNMMTMDTGMTGYGKWNNGNGNEKKNQSENMGVIYDMNDEMEKDISVSSLENNNMEIEKMKGKYEEGRGEERMVESRDVSHEPRHDGGYDGRYGRGHGGGYDGRYGRGHGSENDGRHGSGNDGRYGSGNEIPFWIEDPNVLLYPSYVYEIFPTATMSYYQKLNSITRLIILMTIIGFLFVRNMRILWIGAICLLAIFLLQYTQNKRVLVGQGGAIEGFDDKLESLGIEDSAQAVINAFSTDDPKKIGKRVFFDTPKVNNPYNNVLVTDIVDNPKKLPALPAYYPETEKEILDKTKEAIQKMNPTFPNMTDKLFASLDDHFEFEQSARQFYSNPSTTIPNDQGAFAEFCYGEMISCKEGNLFACARDTPRHNLY